MGRRGDGEEEVSITPSPRPRVSPSHLEVDQTPLQRRRRGLSAI